MTDANIFGTWYFQLFCFYSGFFLVCFQRRVSIKNSSTYLLAGLAGGFFAFWPDKHENVYSFTTHLGHYPFVSLLVSGLAFIFLEREKFYSVQSEGDIFIYTLSFLYYISPWETYHKVLAGIGALPVMLVLYCAFSDRPLSPKLRLGLSFWVLILTVIYCSTQIFTSGVDLATISVKDPGILTVLSYWAGLALTTACGIYLVGSLIPLFTFLKGKGESKYSYENRLADEEQFLESRVLSKQVPLRAILFISIVHGVPLLMNWYFQFVPTGMATSYAMIISPGLTFRASRFFITS